MKKKFAIRKKSQRPGDGRSMRLPKPFQCAEKILRAQSAQDEESSSSKKGKRRRPDLRIDPVSELLLLPPVSDPVASPSSLDMLVADPPYGLTLGDVCQRLELDYDTARYALARVMVPAGVDAKPGSGRHRRFSLGQAYHLGLALQIYAAGVNLPLAAEMAGWARGAQGMAVNLGWDHEFAPFAGQLAAQKQWRLEVANGRLARIVTDANPSGGGMEEGRWIDMESRRFAPAVQLNFAVIIQVDLVQVARMLAGGRAASPTEANRKRSRSEENEN